MENKAYCITEKEIEKLEDIVSYFNYHNKNLTNAQYNAVCYDLGEMVKHFREHYCGTTFRNTDYLNDL